MCSVFSGVNVNHKMWTTDSIGFKRCNLLKKRTTTRVLQSDKFFALHAFLFSSILLFTHLFIFCYNHNYHDSVCLVSESGGRALSDGGGGTLGTGGSHESQ